MASGTSGYLKPKKKTLSELEKADPKTEKRMEEQNPIDNAVEKMDRDNEESKGITQRIRNIFGS